MQRRRTKESWCSMDHKGAVAELQTGRDWRQTCIDRDIMMSEWTRARLEWQCKYKDH